MSNNKKPALGRGLSALLENAKTDITTKQVGENAPIVGSVSMIKIKNIETNPFQPRTNFEELALQELSDSIKQHGIIQPLTLRKLGYDRYQLISGERRFRASQMAGLT
ncbi:MAG TPA: ParB/RepB/Spo0J family partition protein, partial [Bacteroidia bacterium]|nr:ParB/RepB/Spo0J family partition protein [Bacteroidia bacterium]